MCSFFIASVQDDRGNVLAKNEFQYRLDPYILSRLEDSVGINVSANAELIRSFGSGLFNTVFAGEVAGYYKSFRKDNKHIRIRLIFNSDGAPAKMEKIY